jgi:hypothetical protein
MAVPPKGDPRRPLHLAIRSTRVLAVIFLLLGTCSFSPFFLRGPMPGSAGLFISMSVLVFYIGPGVAYLVFSIYLKRRQFWAVVAALVLASIQLFLSLLGGVFFVVAMAAGQSRTPSVPTAVAVIPTAIIGLVVLALAQLVYHLALSFEAIKYAPAEELRGFEPLMGQGIYPPLTGSGDMNDPSGPKSG